MEYKKEGKIGDYLYMNNIGNVGVVTDIKDGKIFTLDAEGKKHQYSVNNKKIIGYSDNVATLPVIASEAEEKENNTKIELTDTSEAKIEAFTGFVNTNKPLLNIREGAGENFKIIGKLRKGDKVNLLPSVNGWYELADQNGYVSDKFIAIG